MRHALMAPACWQTYPLVHCCYCPLPLAPRAAGCTDLHDHEEAFAMEACVNHTDNLLTLARQLAEHLHNKAWTQCQAAAAAT